MTESVPVRFEVLGTEPVHGAGRLVALANVALDVAGLELTLQGVSVTRDGRGALAVRGPVWRHPGSGRWLPALLLPDELQQAIGNAVLALAAGGG